MARDANLCLSTTHIIELVGWKDHDTADAMARWYDAMPIVWTRAVYTDVEEFESDLWTKIAAGVEVESDAKPFAPSLLKAFHSISPEAVAAILAAREPALAMVQALRESPGWHANHQARTDEYIEMLMLIRRNHEWVTAQGWSDERKRQQTAVNIRRSLWQRAEAADRRLTARGDAAYAQKQHPLPEIRARLIDLYETDPRAMPLMRVSQSFNEGANAHVEGGRVVDGQPSKRLREAHESGVGDWMHLVGAAYCDVFTCDGRVAGWLGNVREALGLRRQLAAKGYPGGANGFVRDLMATWP